MNKNTLSPPPVTESVLPVTRLVYHKQLFKYIRIVDSYVGYIRIKILLEKENIYVKCYDYYLLEGNRNFTLSTNIGRLLDTAEESVVQNYLDKRLCII